jgi:prolipoprotein diacylglyceryltransferase
MLQTLVYIPGELFGLPVFGFGLLLGVWAVASVVLLAWQFRRGGFGGDFLGYAQVLAVLGVAIVFVLPALCDPRGLPIRGYGMMMLLAVLCGMGLAVYRARRAGVDPEMIFTLAFWMIVPGIVGARAVYVTEYWRRDFWPVYERTQDFRALLFSVVNVAAGGLVVFGSFIGGMIGLWLFWRRYRIPLLATADLVAPSMLLGLALGRIGCMLNGCCFGGVCDLPWSVTFPWNSPVQQSMTKDGITGVYGLKFRDGSHGCAALESLDPDSPAAKSGLKAGMEVSEINGDAIVSHAKTESAPSVGCSCFHSSEKPTAAELAASAVLRIDKLDIVFRQPDGGQVEWMVDDPPAAQSDEVGKVMVYGVEVVGSDDGKPAVTRVRASWPVRSPEAAAGIETGDRVVSVSGYPVDTIGQLRSLLDDHRRRAWLSFSVVGQKEPIRVYVARPLPRSLPVHPTQLYSALDALILCFLLLAYDPFRRRDGALTALMITVYPITRFLIESIRIDEKPIWGTPFTISQNISIALLAVAIGLWVYILRRPAERAFGGIS